MNVVNDSSTWSGRDALLLVVLGAVWGAVYPLTTVVLRELSTPAVVVARTALAAIVLLPLAAYSGALRAIWARPASVLIAALLQVTIPLVLFTAGQRYVPAGVAGILLASQPVWAAVMTAIVDRALHARQFAGVLSGFCGVALLFLRDIHLGGRTGSAGALLLAAAVFFAAGAIWVERVIPEMPPLGTAAAAMTVSSIFLAPFAAMTTWHIPRLSTIVWLVILGVVATGGALILFYVLVQRIGAFYANLVAYLAPGFAILYGAVFFGERISLIALVGLALILAGSYIAVRR